MTPKPRRYVFKALGCSCEVLIDSDDSGPADRLSNAIEVEVRRIERKFSRYLADSVISEINRASGNKQITVDPETAALLDYAARCFEESGGLFDITSGVLRRAWDFSAGVLPSDDKLRGLLPLIGWDRVSWNNPVLQVPEAGMEIDLGGIGKEYAVDRSAQIAMDHNFTSVLLNFGGDLRAVGPKRNGGSWQIGLTHPREKGGVLTRIELNTGALATSGDYERFMEVDGVRYCHILNPESGYPVRDFQSVSVLAPVCLVAGSATTIAMLLGEQKGTDFLEELNVPFITVSRNGVLRRYPDAEPKSSSASGECDTSTTFPQ